MSDLCTDYKTGLKELRLRVKRPPPTLILCALLLYSERIVRIAFFYRASRNLLENGSGSHPVDAIRRFFVDTIE